MERPQSGDPGAEEAVQAARDAANGSGDIVADAVRSAAASVTSKHLRGVVQQAHETLEHFKRAVDVGLTDAFRQIGTPGLAAELRDARSATRFAALGDVARAAMTSGLAQQAAEAIAGYQRRIAAQLREALAGLDVWKPIARDFLAEQLRALLEARSAVHWHLARNLSQRGWWLVPTWNAALLGQLWDGMALREGRPVVDRILLTHYRFNRHRALSRTIRKWTEPEFAARRKVFREAFTDYRAGRFRQAITALTPHLEGVTKAFCVTEGFISPEEARRRNTPKLVTKHITVEHKHAAVPGLNDVMASVYLEFFWGQPSKGGTRVERHPLSHGAAVAPNSEVAALQVFLLLDTLHYFLSDLRRRQVDAAG